MKGGGHDGWGPLGGGASSQKKKKNPREISVDGTTHPTFKGQANMGSMAQGITVV